MQYCSGPCSLGTVLLARSEAGLCAVLLGDDEAALLADLQARFPGFSLAEGGAEMEELAVQVRGLVEGTATAISFPLDMQGTPFQQRVWAALREVPPGRTVSYGELARRIGAPAGSERAVGAACGANPLAVVVPCHRAVAAGGSLTGYRWGIERKRALLAREGSQALDLFA